MRIAQIVIPHASEYERKCQRVDAAALAASHEVALVSIADAVGFDVAHVYAGDELPTGPFRRFPIPYVASHDVRRSRWPFGKPVAPEYVVTPEQLPEAVEERYFVERPAQSPPLHYTLGTFGAKRKGVANMVEQTLTRIHRFRDDIDWNLYDAVPTPEALA